MKTELVFPSPGTPRWRDQLADLDSIAGKLDDMLAESTEQEDVVRAIARLAVPDLADYCAVDCIEGDKIGRSAIAHRDPRTLSALGPLLDHRAELYEFPQGRRALAGESFLCEFTDATYRGPSMRTPEMMEIRRQLQPTSGIFVPFVVLGTTIATVCFVRTPASGLTQGPRELDLAKEMARRAVVRHAGFPGPRFRGNEDFRLRHVDGFLRENLGASFSLAAVAREAGLSRFHLLRLFKQAYGETPFKRLTRLRLEEAQRRLARTQDPITEIASACGYDNSAHFASAFRRMFGVSPSGFRRLARSRR